MLGKRRLASLALLVAGLVTIIAMPAAADPYTGADCTSDNPAPGCDVTAGTGGQGGNQGTGSGSGGGEDVCHKPSGEVIPCRMGDAWAGSDGCYYGLADDVSAETIAALGGQPDGEGGWYWRTCYGSDGQASWALGSLVWIAGDPPVAAPEVLAAFARSRLNLPDVVIGFNPPNRLLVNLPAWLTLDPSSWMAQSATASVPGVTVTATARPVAATWRMGDGAGTVPEGVVTCYGPGTPWVSSVDPAAASPDCGYTYRRSSALAPGARFSVTVTVTWEVTWIGAGESGTIAGLTTTGTISVPVQTSQAVIS